MLKVSLSGNSPYVYIPKFGCIMLDNTKFQKLIFIFRQIYVIQRQKVLKLYHFYMLIINFFEYLNVFNLSLI